MRITASPEPLLHFFSIGAPMFGAYGLLNRGSLLSPEEVDRACRARRHGPESACCGSSACGNARHDGRTQGLIENWVREEIFYREAVAMGLDRDDALVRRQIGQKLEFMLESDRTTGTDRRRASGVARRTP